MPPSRVAAMTDPNRRPDVQALLRAGRARRRTGSDARERRTELAAAVSFVAAATVLALAAPAARGFALWPAAVLICVFALAARVEFQVSDGTTSPTQLVFVPMLFVLPTPSVPLAVGLGLLLSRLPDFLTGRTRASRAAFVLGDAWFAFPPALVLVLANAQVFSWADWPIYLLALGAQIGVDGFVALARGRWASGVSPRTQAPLLAWIYAVDVALSPVAAVLAAAAAQRPVLALSALPLAALFGLFARDRRQGIDRALELSAAYRGTALLLGDVVEADDEYTGSHSRGVVDLALQVADAFALGADQRLVVEFGALLHDVGKVRVPKEIINKPGPLDDREWAIMRQHTIYGEAMLVKVGGVLAQVGRVVRASHESYDGMGYPDGLVGEAIPIEARIIAACDAYSAMTTDRSYRRAMSSEDAAAELRRCAGSQFDARVVAAVERTLPASSPIAEKLPAPAGHGVAAAAATVA